MDAVDMPKPTSPLTNLPVELLDQIVHFLLEPLLLPPKRVNRHNARLRFGSDFREGCHPEGDQCAAPLALRMTCRLMCDVVDSNDFGEDYRCLHGCGLMDRETLRPTLLLLEEWDCFSVPLPAALRKRRRSSVATNTIDDTPGDVDTNQRFASKITPTSKHTCTYCLRLRPSSHFAISQLTGPRAKDRDAHGGAATQTVSKLRWGQSKRFCIDCGIQREFYASTPVVRFVLNWESEPVMGTGFVCSRHTCKRFVKVEVGGKDEEVEGGLESKEFLRKTCARCLGYRKPGGETRVARGHVMA